MDPAVPPSAESEQRSEPAQPERPAAGRPSAARSLRKRLPLEVVYAITRAHSKLIQSTDGGRQRVVDTHGFPWTDAFERNWKSIQDEALRLLPAVDMLMAEHQLMDTKVHADYPSNWKVFVLYGARQRVPENCRRCPITAALCETVPGLLHAFFSIMKPRSHIKAHRAIYNGRLRYHLGLKVPSQPGAARLRVDTEVLHWAEGQSFVFDDTYEHEAWNDSDEERIVLIIDFLRPLPEPFYAMNQAFVHTLMRFIANQGRRNVEAWERSHGQQLDDLLRPSA